LRKRGDAELLKKIKFTNNSGVLVANESKTLSSLEEAHVEKQVQELSEKILTRIFSSFSMVKIEILLFFLKTFFQQAYKKIVVNEN